jgi:U3 small nucleolar RNA-associated protein 22
MSEPVIERSFQRIYPDTFKLFHDLLGGNRIGLVWEPSIRQSRPFRVMSQYSSRPASEVTCQLSLPKPLSHVSFVQVTKVRARAEVVLNEAAILRELARLGDGLIKSIIIQT